MKNRFKKDENKLLIALSYGFNKTIEKENLTTKDFDKYQIVYQNSTIFAEKILQKYYVMMDLYQKQVKKCTIFDKVLCLGIILKSNPSLEVLSPENAPKNIADLKERSIMEAMLALLQHSTYQIKGETTPIPLDIQNAFIEHQEELNSILQELITILKNDKYDYEQVLTILNKIYFKAISYNNGLEENIDEKKLKKNVTIKETSTADHLTYTRSTILKKLREERNKKNVH